MKSKSRLIQLVAGMFFLTTAVAPVVTSVRAGTTPEAAELRVHPVWFHVRRGPVGESFFLANDAVIRLGTNSEARLGDLAVGQKAEVYYTIENGTWYAHEIVVNPPHGAHASRAASAARKTELHANGAILAYNTNTGNLTIRYHR